MEIRIIRYRKRHSMLRHWSSDAGVVALEFALIVPFFLLLIFGTMVFALYFATFVAVIHGANEGARASVGGISDVERGQLAVARVQYIFTAYSPLLKPALVNVQTQAVPGAMFKVTVQYPLNDFKFGAFYNLLTAVGKGNAAQPQKIGYSVTIANGGY
ncbi:TadE/TadG family type IV pilus assembly protein [Sphingomonas paeninsulae]|nr:TadE/TadG family type IV pilus assembly protein [Sphingomonas paeninsulae]